MVANWNNEEFLNVISNIRYSLPIEPLVISYEVSLNDLLIDYQSDISALLTYHEKIRLKSICKNINTAVEKYHKGLPSDAYKEIAKLMNKLSRNPLGILEKSSSQLSYVSGSDRTPLYRMVIPFKPEGESYTKKDLFHLPYSLRKKASSCRYSIAGYPSLYLGTTIELCASEIDSSLGLVSKYQFDNSRFVIKIYDLAIKPSDFRSEEKINNIKHWTSVDIREETLRKNYVLWYPLIAACSYIREDDDKKMNLFASEYIIPQLTMQWLRKKENKNELFGIRYFSSNSVEDSESGYNYVLPVSGESHNGAVYCSVLAKCFKISSPYWVGFDSIKKTYYKNMDETEDYEFI